MRVLVYILELAWDNLVWIGIVAGIILLAAPYRAWTLLRNNRPGRGSGWKMWLADRYIQIWLARRPLPSGQARYEYAMPTGFNGTTMEHGMTQQTIDEKLQSYWLVHRTEGGKVYARRDWYLFLHNWMVSVICKWYLIAFLGDSPKWYEEIAAPLSKPEQILQRFFRKVGWKIFELAYLIFAAFLMLLLLRFILMPLLMIYTDLVLKHLPTTP